MGKTNRSKKKNGSDLLPMDVGFGEKPLTDVSQDMDTSETVAAKPSVDELLRKTKKGRPMKRSKNVRKMKAVQKAVSLNEKSEEKISKNESKLMRTKSAKKLYD